MVDGAFLISYTARGGIGLRCRGIVAEGATDEDVVLTRATTYRPASITAERFLAGRRRSNGRTSCLVACEHRASVGTGASISAPLRR